MPRTKGGYATRRRRKKVLRLTKGYFGSKHLLFRVGKQAVMKSLKYAYRDRKDRKSTFRKLWIVRINAAARMSDLSYSQLMHGLKLGKIDINRKMLADLAVNDIATFAALCERAKTYLAK
jgi:large subunit ribosomal protein L20